MIGKKSVNLKSSVLAFDRDQVPTKCTLLTVHSILSSFKNGSISVTDSQNNHYVSYKEPVMFWACANPLLYCIHKNQALTVTYMPQTLTYVYKNLEIRDSVCGTVANDDRLVVVTNQSIDTYVVKYNVLKESKLSLKKYSYETDFANLKLQSIKLCGKILACVVNDNILIFDIYAQSQVLFATSKNGSYFLITDIHENIVVAATSEFMHIWTVDELNTSEIIIPLKVSISAICFHKNLLICGLFDGSINVYSIDLDGTLLYQICDRVMLGMMVPQKDSKPSPGSISNPGSPRDSLYTFNRVTAIIVFDQFLLASWRNGLCGIWSLTQRNQISPIVALVTKPDEYVQQILKEGSGNRPNITLQTFDVEKNTYGLAKFAPKVSKIRDLLNESLIATYMSKPKGEKKGILKEWKQSTSKGMTDHQRLEYIQELSQKQYPYLMEVYESCTITNNTLPDNPIVFVNDDFIQMTGYPREEIYGQNCRFLQGKYTDAETVKRVSMALKNGKTVSVQILNYRKDGTPFWNVFVILPVCDEKGTVPAFIAIQKNVTKLKLAERPFEEWMFYEVAMWLELVGYRVYAHLFIDRNIDGRILGTLTQEDLRGIGVSDNDSLGVLEMIKNLKSGMNLSRSQSSSDMKKIEIDFSSASENDTMDTSSETSWNNLFREVIDRSVVKENPFRFCEPNTDLNTELID